MISLNKDNLKDFLSMSAKTSAQNPLLAQKTNTKTKQ